MEFLRKPVVGYMILAVGILLAVFFYTNTVNEKLREGLASSCQRVNILRAQSNLSDNVSWTILSASAAREKKLAATEPQNRKTHKSSYHILSKQASNLTITPITDCDKAVNEPKSYVVPKAHSIGDKKTLKQRPEVAKILSESKALLRAENVE